QDGQFDQIADEFAREGIASDRIKFHARCDIMSYLRMHAHVDVCVDTFPYTGGTTVAHALLMGVPTLILAGRTPPGRLGAALLRHAGLDDFVADGEDEYIESAIRV